MIFYRVLLVLMLLDFQGCTTLGIDFDETRASRIRSGMTRDEVLAVMETPPSSVEGADPWRLTWFYSVADPISFGTRSKRVSVTFDQRGRAEGVPANGLVPEVYQ